MKSLNFTLQTTQYITNNNNNNRSSSSNNNNVYNNNNSRKGNLKNFTNLNSHNNNSSNNKCHSDIGDECNLNHFSDYFHLPPCHKCNDQHFHECSMDINLDSDSEEGNYFELREGKSATVKSKMTTVTVTEMKTTANSESTQQLIRSTSCPGIRINNKKRRCTKPGMDLKFILMIYILTIIYTPSESFGSSRYTSLLPSMAKSELTSCDEVFKWFPSKLPCLCSRPTGGSNMNDQSFNQPWLANGTYVNCDHVTFFGDFPTLPSSVYSFSQRNSFIQSIEPQMFTLVPLRRLDLSNNNLRRILDRTFDGIESTLLELDLSHNLLGDQLNPIYSCDELLHLKSLTSLDLSHNELKALDNNLFKGLRNLTNLNLAGNELTYIPVGSLTGLTTLRYLNLGSNRIKELSSNSFPTSLDSLRMLNLTANSIEKIKDGSFSSLESLTELYLSSNRIKDLTGHTLVGLKSLELIDLSNNFLEYIPSETLHNVKKIKRINLSANNIISVDDRSFADLTHLETLDLSRNNIKVLTNLDAFSGLRSLKSLNLGYNKLKSIDELDEAIFAPMVALEVLDLTDNEILNFPTRALNGLPSLKKLFLDFNLIGKVTEDHLSTVTKLDELSLSYNLITELPDDVFIHMDNLRLLNLHGNKIDSLAQNTFNGISDNLLGLDVGFNDLLEVPKLSLPKLIILNIAMNQFTHITPTDDIFRGFPSLRFLNMSHNQISFLPSGLFENNQALEIIDISGNLLDKLSTGSFSKMNLTTIYIKSNQIKDISSSTFHDLPKIRIIDLSNNAISNIKNNAFDGTSNLRLLDLSFNKLTSFKGDFFTTRTRMDELILSNNAISYLYPNSFNIHRRLKRLDLSNNRLSFFPTEIITGIKTLESINLSKNKLTSLESADFSNMAALRTLDLSMNDISFIPSNAFGNSSKLSSIDLSNNRITSVGETAFKGVSRLSLDLSRNKLTALPSELFNRHLVFHLVSLNLAHNNLSSFPSSALRRQYSNLQELNLAHNKINSLPLNSDVLVNLKSIDLSHNPLSQESISSFLTEPKSVRSLNLAFTGISNLPNTLEMPFIRKLNFSNNEIRSIGTFTFEKSSLLKVLDLSGNKLSKLSINLPSNIWKKLPELTSLYLSRNAIQTIMKGDFESLGKLKILDISHLPSLNHLECETLSSLPNLETLSMFAYPLLEKLGVQECASHLNLRSIKSLAIEFKESSLQGHLQRLFYYSKLDNVYITGNRLSSISSSSLNGIKCEEITLSITGTRITSIPESLFSSLLLSSKINLNLDNNQISSLPNELITSLDNKLMSIRITGLNSNPFICDCRAEPFWKWINLRIRINPNVQYYNSFVDYSNVTCSLPTHLNSNKLSDLEVEQLACTSSGTGSGSSASSGRGTFTTSSVNQSSRSSPGSTISSTTASPPVIIVGPKRGSTSPASNNMGTSIVNKVRMDSSPSSPTDSMRDNRINRRTGSGSGSNSQQATTSTRGDTLLPNKVHNGNNVPFNKIHLETIRDRDRNGNNNGNTYHSSTNQANGVKNRATELTRVDTMIIGIIAGIIAFICILIVIICMIKIKSSFSSTSSTQMPVITGMTTKSCSCSPLLPGLCPSCSALYGGRNGPIGPPPSRPISVYGHAPPPSNYRAKYGVNSTAGSVIGVRPHRPTLYHPHHSNQSHSPPSRYMYADASDEDFR